MRIKTNVYTSCYSKMLARHKMATDIYIQVSRSLFLPKKGVDGKSMGSMIDVSYGQDLGMYDNSLDEYEQRIRGEEYTDILRELAETFTEKFLLADLTDKDLEEIEEIKGTLEEMKAELLKKTYEENLAEWNSATQEEKETLYMFGFTESTLKNVADWEPCLTYNCFLLCFEDLETTYTEKDEKKYNGACKAGTFKICHRTNLARVLNERFSLNISEWK